MHLIAAKVLIAFTAAVSAGVMPAVTTAKSSYNPILGYDISYPQCSKALPQKQAFGIVGVNGGLANTTNRCLKTELTWGASSTGATSQQKLQLYVNTANPGGLGTASWPKDNLDPSNQQIADPYGDCDGANSQACAWQYGWNRANEDVWQRFSPAAATAGIDTNPGSYTWWLDVETINTWLSGSNDATSKNAADLEGMTAYFKSLGASVGLYSTTAQWSQIAGTPGTDSNLYGLVNWRPGARSLSAAKSNCSLTPLTAGGTVVLTQYLSNNLDYDYSCS